MHKKINEELSNVDNQLFNITSYQTKVKFKNYITTTTTESVVDKKLKSACKYKPVSETPENKVYGSYIEDKSNKKIVDYKIKQSELETSMLNSAKKIVNRQKTKYSKIFNWVFVILNLAIIMGILVYQRNTLGVLSFQQLFNGNTKFVYFGYILIIFAVIVLLETLRNHLLIKTSSSVNKPWLSYRSWSINKYYDNILPVSGLAGGKAVEVYYLHTKGIKPSVATSVPLAKVMFGNIATFVISTIVIASKWTFISETNSLVLGLGLVMLLVNMITIIGMLFISLSKRTAPRMLLTVLSFLEKIRIVKDSKVTFYKTMRFVLEYQKSFEYYIKAPFTMIVSMLSTFALSFLNALIPVMIYGMFVPISFGIGMDIIVKYYILLMTVNFNPLPGGVGMTDIVFSAIFADVFTGGTLFWALIIYRFFTYFIYLIQGMFVVFYEAVKKNRQLRRTGKFVKESIF